jgi:hypothetical protein
MHGPGGPGLRGRGERRGGQQQADQGESQHDGPSSRSAIAAFWAGPDNLNMGFHE